ncbi:hypothetical protein Dimus_032077, partial [Dionaea muscipula]
MDYSGSSVRGQSQRHGGFLVFANSQQGRCLGGTSGRADSRVWRRPACARSSGTGTAAA